MIHTSRSQEKLAKRPLVVRILYIGGKGMFQSPNIPALQNDFDLGQEYGIPISISAVWGTR